MGELGDTFMAYKSKEGRLLHKQPCHIGVYERLLEPYRGRKLTLVEIGIGYGGCLQMWRDYLGPETMVYGLERNENYLFSDERIQCFHMDQADRSQLSTIHSLIPNIDIFIDDASHICQHQIDTFEEVFPHIKQGGLYVVEDVHTSYRKDYGGEYLKPDSFVEYCKRLVDGFSSIEDKRIPVNDYAYNACEVAFLPAMITIRKQ